MVNTRVLCLCDLAQNAGRGGNEAKVRLAGNKDSAQVLGVELHTDKPGVVFQLDDLHTNTSLVLADEGEALCLELVDVVGVDFVAVSVALVDALVLKAVERTQLRPLGVGLPHGRPQAEAHGTTDDTSVVLWHGDDDAVLITAVEFKGCRLRQRDVAHRASELDNGDLHTKADTKVGSLVLTGPLGSGDHSLGASCTEATGDQDTRCCADVVPRLVECRRVRLVGSGLEVFGVHHVDNELAPAAHGSVLERLDDRAVRVRAFEVLSNENNANVLPEALESETKALPGIPDLESLCAECGRDLDGVQTHGGGHVLEHVLLVKQDRDLVGRGHVAHVQDVRNRDLAETSDLLDCALLERLLAAARNQVGHQTGRANGPDGHLCRLRLLLAVDRGNVGDVDLHEVLRCAVVPEFAKCLDKGHALNVTNSATELDNTDVRLLVGVVDRDLGDLADPLFDRSSDVRHDLYRLAQVVTAALPLDDLRVDLAEGDVVVSCEGDIEVALVVAQVEIDFSAIVQDVDFSMLFRVHGAGVGVDVRVDLDARDLQAHGLEQQASGRGLNM